MACSGKGGQKQTLHFVQDDVRCAQVDGRSLRKGKGFVQTARCRLSP